VYLIPRMVIFRKLCHPTPEVGRPQSRDLFLVMAKKPRTILNKTLRPSVVLSPRDSPKRVFRVDYHKATDVIVIRLSPLSIVTMRKEFIGRTQAKKLNKDFME